jgi:hypothetical protein
MNSDAPYESAVWTSLIPLYRAGGNHPPHFEKLSMAKLIPLLFFSLN